MQKLFMNDRNEMDDILAAAKQAGAGPCAELLRTRFELARRRCAFDSALRLTLGF
jgi:hypothetical protein